MSAPTPVPRPRASWREPRFVLGVVLVVASIAGVAGLLQISDRSVRVYAARHVLAAGDAIRPDDLVLVQVRLGGALPAYLSSAPKGDAVATRTIAAGELVPLGALGAAGAGQRTSVVISIDGALPAAVTVGSSVDVWSATAEQGAGAGARRFEAPRVLVAGAVVVRVAKDTGLGAGNSVAVEVRVPKTATAALLESLANRDQIAILPAGS